MQFQPGIIRPDVDSVADIDIEGSVDWGDSERELSSDADKARKAVFSANKQSLKGGTSALSGLLGKFLCLLSFQIIMGTRLS